MAAISSIQGLSDAALTGQVEKTARPAADQEKKLPSGKAPEMVQPKGINTISDQQETEPSSVKTVSYEETMAVVEKLQSRIDEVASAPHKVSIRTDEVSQQYIIQIQDPDGEVVKQFPSEKVLNLHRKLDDLSGMVIDEMI